MAGRKWFGVIAVLGATTGVAVAASVTGCGSSSGNASAAHIQITAPVDGSDVRGNRITVRGTVSPPDAAVQVLGQPAQVGNNLFSSSVSLHSGANHIDVVATAPGANPTTTAVTVIRSGNGKVQVTPTPAPSSTGTASGGGSGGGGGGGGRTDCGGGLMAGPNTTCAFAQNVLAAYRRTGGGTVQVYSPVTRQTYSISCTSSPPHVCTGANNASVYFP
jgi:Glucodextranase, domain B